MIIIYKMLMLTDDMHLSIQILSDNAGVRSGVLLILPNSSPVSGRDWDHDLDWYPLFFFESYQSRSERSVAEVSSPGYRNSLNILRTEYKD